MAPNPLFVEDVNCWRTERADHAAVLIDCARYYKALHEAICAARRSVFVVGWDIDSRIELLRGRDAARSPYPAAFFDLIQWKARQDPAIEIYLNRWDYSLFFAGQREGFSGLKWRLHSPMNVHYCLDGMVPVGACHHQKIVVIDDDVAFSGGMDIALFRWDRRSHHLRQRERCDPGGLGRPARKQPFAPYHDIQMVCSGPLARALGQLARARWRAAAGYDAVPAPAPAAPGARPACWPESAAPQFRDIDAAISLTLPAYRKRPGARQVERGYIDMIGQAEKFIYIENQYLTRQSIARALNRRLRERPGLRVLAVSCYTPNGRVEAKSMWAGRVRFRELLEAGGCAPRALMAYPSCREDGAALDVHIHSKIMAVDDRFFRVGSSNLNNRSMGLDTECDITLCAGDEKARAAIAALRNDLIREHTGMEIAEIARLIEGGADAQRFLRYLPDSTHHLCRINDEAYRFARFTRPAIRLGDPGAPLFPDWLAVHHRYPVLHRSLVSALAIAALILLSAALWEALPDARNIPEIVREAMGRNERMHAALLVFILYMLGGLMFFPLTISVIATVAAFGMIPGLALAFIGALAGAATGFAVGRLLDFGFLRAFLGSAADRYRAGIRQSGLAGVAMLRLAPVAPFTAINLGLGIVRVPFLTFIAGSLIGMLPGIFAISLFAEFLTRLWKNPTFENGVFCLAGLAGWFLLFSALSFAADRWSRGRA
jgi:phosphatidylserine/phosphatidylglycerophosphate/cardiolipin synthase-like enzyme/uncharacterized membrane protein YdjX (TVP38/TMEM64 family)